MIAFTLFSFFLSICVGAQPLGLGEVWSALFREGDGLNRTIVWNIRFPRALVGALAGACLAVSGVVLQGIMRNPLASPGTATWYTSGDWSSRGAAPHGTSLESLWLARDLVATGCLPRPENLRILKKETPGRISLE